MSNLTQNVEAHYFKNNLYQSIINALKSQGVNLDKIKRSDIETVDEFHVRGATVSKELANAINLNNKTVLDVGCGLGGPCRMLADNYNCKTVGIDLSKAYIETATQLSKLLGLNNKTTFIYGNALKLPFKANSFDVVWTQHVQMNIADKNGFYSEIQRVLKPRGYFLYYEILKKNDGKITYPTPWASNENLSFLFKEDSMHNILNNLGFRMQKSTDQTQAGIAFFSQLLLKIKERNAPKIGLNLLMGDSTLLKLTNLYNHLKEGNLELKSGVYKKE